MNPYGWYIIVGVAFTAMALLASFIRRMPLTTAIPYLILGWIVGPHGLGYLQLDPFMHARAVQTVAEVSIIISLFAAGLTLRAQWTDPKWYAVARLAFGSMALTVVLIALAGVYLLHLSWGAAFLLGGILAPTDPVLATDVQLVHPYDPSPLRFSLTGEAALNDGATFPFIVLGLGLLGLPRGSTGLHWVGIDVFWGILSAFALGWALGTGVAKLVLYLRQHRGQALGLGYFLAPGLIALTYGLALFIGSYGFIAVFVAGLAFRHVELDRVGAKPPDELMELAVPPSHRAKFATGEKTAPVYLLQALLRFSEELEQIGEAVVVALVGSMISVRTFTSITIWLLPLLFLVIRPLSVKLGLLGGKISRFDHLMISWFGIRGIGSVYYVAYVIGQGIPRDLAHYLLNLTLAVVATSIIIHGTSVTPLMNHYSKRLSKA